MPQEAASWDTLELCSKQEMDMRRRKADRVRDIRKTISIMKLKRLFFL